MASYHLSVKPVSRSTGRSATAAAAYRAAERIEDERTGLVHDYRRRSGVLLTQIVLPDDAPAWAQALDRAALWNAAEAAENRKNSVVAREWEVGLPADLPAQARQDLALALARDVANRHGIAVDVALHAPGRGDDRNYHVHILGTTRRLGAEGFAEKTRELDDRSRPKDGGPSRGSLEVTRWRQHWEELQNAALKECGSEARVDCRTLREQGIPRAPQHHLGPVASAMERRGTRSDRGEDCRREQQSEQEMLDALARVEADQAHIDACLRAERVAAATEASLRELVSAELHAEPPPPLPRPAVLRAAGLSVREWIFRWRQRGAPRVAPPVLPVLRSRLGRLRERVAQWLAVRPKVGAAPPLLPAIGRRLGVLRERIGGWVRPAEAGTPPPPPVRLDLRAVLGRVQQHDSESDVTVPVSPPPPAPTLATAEAADVATQVSLVERFGAVVSLQLYEPPPDLRLQSEPGLEPKDEDWRPP